MLKKCNLTKQDNGVIINSNNKSYDKDKIYLNTFSESALYSAMSIPVPVSYHLGAVRRVQGVPVNTVICI